MLPWAVPGPAHAVADSFSHHVVAVHLAPKDEQAKDAALTDFYIDMGRTAGALPGTEFWVYRIEQVGAGRQVAIPVGRLRAFHIEERVSIARLTSLTLPEEDALVDYRTIMVGDAVEPIRGTGLPPLGERDLPAEVVAVDPGLVPPLQPGERAVRTFSIPNVVLFDFDKSTLRLEGKAILDQIAAFVRDGGTPQVRIEGHTDSVGTVAYNQSLSQRRATAVKEYLATARQIPPGHVTAVGYGEARPVASNATAAGRQRNRRSEITVDGRTPGPTEPDGLAIAPEAVVPESAAQAPPASEPASAPASEPASAPAEPATPASAAASQGGPGEESPFPEMARPRG